MTFRLPDPILWATTYLRAGLASYGQPVTVSDRVPSPRVSRMVIVRRDGGQAPNVVMDRVRLSLRVWGPDEAEVVRLLHEVRALMGDAPGAGPCRAWSELSVTSVPDESEQPLRYLVGEAMLRGVTT